MIYLDNASTTQVDENVVNKMLPYLSEQYGNAGTLYGLGRDAARAVREAREQVANFINAKPEQIIFTSGGSEANNMAIQCLQFISKKSSSGKEGFSTKWNTYCSSIEHDSVYRAVSSRWNTNFYSDSDYTIPVDNNGCVDMEYLNDIINKDKDLIRMISIMYVNNEVGSVNDVYSISEICKENNIIFHTDCVQAASCMNIDVNKIGCDALSISSHKIHGPKGVGCLYIKNPEKYYPLVYGGKSQEFGLRGGTENVAGIVGFGEACRLQSKSKNNYCEFRELFLKTLSSEMCDLKCDISYHINGHSSNITHGKIINITFDGIDGESLVLMMDTKGVCISSGSACRSHETTPSRVLMNMGLSKEAATNSVRISFSRFTDNKMVIDGAKALAKCVSILNDIKNGK